ncbi:MAG: hypothetical protein K5795_06200 [Lachnospiraceae bacterium]|nr:hypothetical protein [Lachnospiraceae bacterium]
MTEEMIKSLIKDTLAIPVFLGSETIVYPGATLEMQSISPVLYGDGKAKRRAYTVYINLWYENKDDRDEAVDTLIPVLDGQDGITAPEIETYYDTTAKKFRAVVTFQTFRLPAAALGTEEPEENPGEGQ